MAVQHRAYSVLTIKDLSEESRQIEGVASTPVTDRMGDIVEPKGATFTLPLPLLWQHRSDQPIGHVTEAKVTPDGIQIKAQIAKDLGIPRIDEAWALIKAGLVRGLSIGFQALETERIKDTFGQKFLKWEWLELSAVTIPANGEASILSIKSADVGVPAVSREGRPVFITPRVAGGSHTEPSMKPITDQIKDFENTRAAKVAEMDTLQAKVAGEGRTKDVSEKENFDTLSEQIKQLDAEMADLRTMETLNKAMAKPVAGDTAVAASASRANNVVTVSRVDKRPGIGFAKMAMCVAASRGNYMQAAEMAKMHYPDDGGIFQYLQKAAVAAATTANTSGVLLQYTDFLGDFVEYLRPMTIVGKFGTNGIPDVRHVPFNMRVSTQTSGSSAYWVGQGKPKPLTHGVYSTITLDFHKVATIAVLTKEEVRFASPSAEAKVRDDIVAAVVARIDQDFIDPANAGTAGVKPASITNGVAASAVSGTDADAVRVDLKTLINGMIAAGIQPTSLVLIMSQQIALSLSLMRTALGSDEFPTLTMNGGTLSGIPVIVSEYVTSLGSPAGSMLVAVNAQDIYLADDGGVSVEASDQASLEMLDASLVQDGTVGTGASLVSLWQSNLLGLRAEREITWKKRRSAAVAYASPVAYTPST